MQSQDLFENKLHFYPSLVEIIEEQNKSGKLVSVYA